MITVAATLAALVVVGLVFIYSGLYSVAATEDHTSIGRWVLNTTQHRSVSVRARDLPDPPAFDSAMVADGFAHFRAMCIVCHGAPGVDRGELGQGITPTPPSLSEAAAEFDTRELFWMVKNGIKLAGMPAFGPTHSDDEIWGLVAFLEELEGMTAEEYQRWEADFSSGAGTNAGAGAGGAEGAAGHSHAAGAPSHDH